MRPTHEVLELAWPHLYYPDRTNGEPYICYALLNALGANKLTASEYDEAELCIRTAVHRINRGSTFLVSAAKTAGLVPIDCSSRSPEYIPFRDQWLRELIAKEQAWHTSRIARPAK